LFVKPKIPIFGKFWRALRWKILKYFMTIRSILHTAIGKKLWSFGIFCGILYQEKSGNPGSLPVYLR
jgi:hypothetical protein